MDFLGEVLQTVASRFDMIHITYLVPRHQSHTLTILNVPETASLITGACGYVPAVGMKSHNLNILQDQSQSKDNKKSNLFSVSFSYNTPREIPKEV